MSQYNNMEYAQTEYQQCNNIKYNNENVYYNGRNDTYDSYDSYDNYYDQGNRMVNNPAPPVPKRSSGERIPVNRPSTRRPPPPINNTQNMMGQMTPRPSPQIRPINAVNSVRQSPQIRPINAVNSVRQSPQLRPINNAMNAVRQSPQLRPVNNSRPVTTRKPTTAMAQPPRPSAPVRPLSMSNPSRSSPQLKPQNLPTASNSMTIQNVPPTRPLPPPVQRKMSSPQLRPRNNSNYVPGVASEAPSNSPKLPIRSQSSLSNLQKQKSRQPLAHSNLSTSNTLEDDAFEPPIPPRTRQHRGASISSQGSADNYSVADGNAPPNHHLPHAPRKHSMGSETSVSAPSSMRKYSEPEMHYKYEDRNAVAPSNGNANKPMGYYDSPALSSSNYNGAYTSQPNTQAPTPNPVPTPQYSSNAGAPPTYYTNYNKNGPAPGGAGNNPSQPTYNSNTPVNFHPQAMYNGIGNQYRPPPAKPKPAGYEGKLPMTSLGGQPMPYGQSLEMYRQNAKRSNDPHVQLEFAKYLIAMADAALDSDPDQKIAQRNQEILYNEGLKWIKKLASQGGGLGKTPYAEAQFFLAECYGNGSIGLQIDHEKAFSYYLQASKQSHPPSTYRAAVCYEHGAGTKKDFQRAVQFYRKAAALGDVLSMYKLGTILLNGTLNQDKNPREGLTWLKRAAAQADQTCPHALHELGMIYEGKNPETNGLIIPDPNYSQELYLKAAQFGYSPSQYKLGLCYEYGLLNLPIDSRRSIAWYSKAAEQGDPEAELALSGWYLTGADNVLVQSDKEAFLWARKAANKGLAKAEYAVGYYYENGIGVKKDLEEAKRSYLSAASQNNKRALVRLKEMKAGYVGHGPIQGWREQSRGTGAASEDCIIS